MLAASSSYTEALERLGVTAHVDAHARLGRRVDELGLDRSHLERPPSVANVGRRPQPGSNVRSGYSDSELAAAVASSESYSAALRALGRVPKGGNYATLKRRIAALGLSTDHFVGRGWARGRNQPRVSLEQALVAGRPTLSGLPRRLLAEGLFKRECAKCQLTVWQGHPIPLELEHKNGDNTDNRIENLELLCPNCHALTPTWRGRNIRRRRVDVDPQIVEHAV